MPAMDALHLKNQLREDLNDGFYARFMNGFVGSLYGSDTEPNDGDQTRKNLARVLDVGEVFYLDPRMSPLVTAASESMPEETIQRGDLPATHGFLWIPGGVGTIDIRGNVIKVNAMVWADTGYGVDLIWLTDKNDPDDTQNRTHRETKVWATMPRLTPSHISSLVYGKPLPFVKSPNFIIPPEVKIESFDNQSTGEFGWFIPKGFGPDELRAKFDAVGRETDPICKYLLTVWRLMQQRITNTREETAPRQQRRAMERKNLRPKVTVIELRAHESHGDGSTEVEWSHRWLVRGHWRKQPCKENGEWTHRLIWVHPFVKGPAGKPLLIREHVYSLTR